MKFLIIFALGLISILPQYSRAELAPTPYEIQYQTERQPGYDVEKDIRSIESFIGFAESQGWATKVEVTHSRTWIRKSFKEGESVPALVVGTTRGCKNFDEECRKAIEGLNRRGNEIFSPSFQGELSIPVEAITYKIQIFAGNEHRTEIIEAANGKKYLKQRVSTKFLNLLQSYVPNKNSFTGVICLGKYPDRNGHYYDPYVSRRCSGLDFEVEELSITIPQALLKIRRTVVI